MTQNPTSPGEGQAWRDMRSAPQDGTLFLAWREVLTFDEDVRRERRIGEPCIAQVVFGEALSVPIHSQPQGQRFVAWQPITPARATNTPEAEGGAG